MALDQCSGVDNADRQLVCSKRPKVRTTPNRSRRDRAALCARAAAIQAFTDRTATT